MALKVAPLVRPAMRAFRLAYDGTDYHGFQRQPDVPTVSDAVLDALRALDVCVEGEVPPGYAAAGRTDAGVSATHQTIAFDAPDWLGPAALNSELPAAVRAWALAEAAPDFHATHDAVEREYTYYLHVDAVRGAVDPTGSGTDRAGPGTAQAGGGADGPDTSSAGEIHPAPADRARNALARLAGEHDFHNLTPDDSGTVRTLSTDLAVDPRYFVLTVRADGFPRQLVRRLVAVVIEAASDAARSDRIDRLLGSEPVDGPAGVAPAPPAPLVLTDVAYPRLDFRRDAEGIASARSVFADRRRRLATRARVASRLGDL